MLTQLRPDVAFNALHGPDGEDGTIQGLLEILKIPYTHSGVLASALAMNKERAKTVMRAAGVDVPGGRIVNRMDAAREHALPPPYVIKPIAEGSSMGVIIVRDGRSHPPQILASDEWQFGDASPCGTLHCRPRADLRGDGGQGPRGHRGQGVHGGVVRLRRQVRPGGVDPRPAGRT